MFARRPDNGRAGRPVPLRTNFFAVRSLPAAPVHHYALAIVPDVPPARARRVVAAWLAAAAAAGAPLNGAVFDGRSNIFSPTPLPLSSDAQTVFLVDVPDDYEPSQTAHPRFPFPLFQPKNAQRSLPPPAPNHSKEPHDNTSQPVSQLTVANKPSSQPTSAASAAGALAQRSRSTKRFQITITKVAQINMQRLGAYLDGIVPETPYDAMLALDVLLRHRPSMIFTTVGRCFYTADSAVPIANGAQLWQGFHQSLRPSRGQMLINLDVSATAFYQPGPVIDMIAKILGRNSPADLRGPLTDKDRIKVEKSLKGLKIFVTHRGQVRRKYRIVRLTATPASRTMFPLNASGAEESVANYFLAKYNKQLYFAHLLCAVVGDPARPIYLPLEVCEIVAGQRHLRKLNERQTAEMIKFTCQPPHVRSNKISAGITLLQQQDNEFLRDFGVQIDHEMAIINARVLPAPAISYHPASKEPVITPREGAWNLRDKMVAQGVTLRSWCVLAFGAEQDYPVTAIQKFITLLVQTCEECGIFVQHKQPPISYASPFGDIERTLIDAYMVAGDSYQERPQLIVCILPNTSVPLYAEIKRVSDTVIGIATQCIQAKHMFAAKRQYCANVCLKINVKLGGMNSYLSSVQLPFVSERPTIIFGADVTHPAIGSQSNQSIAALVASMDAQCSRYAASIRVQRGRFEHIQDLGGMVIELLKIFYQTCAAKPERMLFFRDGVSEGQYLDVLRREIEAIRQACNELEEGYQPTITYVVVQKRHHARFFPIRREDSDRSGNVLPGTVVESGITHPFEFDFYLCSHPGLQGTSKPTYYHVLFDENRFTSDSLQELTYRLCYLYCRATRSVSVVPPAYYAHLVAARARFHASGEETIPDTISVVSSGSGRHSTSHSSQQPLSSGPVASGGLVGSSAAAPPPSSTSTASTASQINKSQQQQQQQLMAKRFSMASLRSALPTIESPRTLLFNPVKPELTRVMYFM